VPSVGRNLLTETVMKLDENFIDYKSVKLSDIDLIAIKINTTSQVFHPIGGKPPSVPPAINPERNMIRYQFLEFLVRIAIERQGKRIRNKGGGTDDRHYFDAIKKFFEVYALAYFATFDSHTWRRQRYWTHDVELILIKHGRPI
jgi:hypothetical protein